MADIVCLINVEAESVDFTWSEGPASFEPYTLDGMAYQDFRELAEEARKKLGHLVSDYMLDAHNVPRGAYELAVAGHKLYRALFDPGADQALQARQVRRWLEELSKQRVVDTLEVVVESPWFLPWNVVYDQEPDEAAFLSEDDSPDRWKPFWGLRYNLAGGRKVDPLRRMPVLTKPDVLMVVDTGIRDGLPEKQRQRLVEVVETYRFNVVHTKEALQDAVKAERPELLYWLSHASADALVLAGEPLSPRYIRKLFRPQGDEEFGGLAFLNACQTAERGSHGSFFEAFHSVGFAGIIGTEQQTIDQFANTLGLDFLVAFVGGERVGEIMRKLRGRVPMGLLYGTYCPPDIHLHVRDVNDSVVITLQPSSGGRLLGDAAAQEVGGQLPAEPYRSLVYYDRLDRALFAGRDNDVQRFARLLDAPGVKIVALHGESGVGKSSFLRAGLIPYLEEECLGYRFLHASQDDLGGRSKDAVLFVRATNDLVGQLAQVLCEFCARPFRYDTPAGDQVEVDLPGLLARCIDDGANPAQLRRTLCDEPLLLGSVLSELAGCLPFAPVVVIDQAEEVFTLAQSNDDVEARRAGLRILRLTLAAPGDFKIILSLRTEYYGRLTDHLRQGSRDATSIREYLLTDFDEKKLIDAITRPTERSPLHEPSKAPFEKYGFWYQNGVAEEIARKVSRFTARRRDSVLPLMQVICNQLYHRVRDRDDKQITAEDLAAVGGVEGGMRTHVEHLLGELASDQQTDKRDLKRLFTQLYLRQPDGSLTTALLPAGEVERHWHGRMPFEALLDAAVRRRLLRVNNLHIGSEDEHHYVSLGHDALANLAADWDDELGRAARMRKMAAVIGGVSAVAVVLAILATFAWLAGRRARQNEQLANENLKVAYEAVDSMLTQVGSESLKDVPQMEDVRVELLAKAHAFYVQLAAAEETSSNLQTALAHRRLGDIYQIRGGRSDLARAEAEYKTSIKQLGQLQRHFGGEYRYARQLAISKMWLGVLQLRTKQSAAAATLKAARQLQEMLRTTHSELEADPAFQQERARTLLNEGYLFNSSEFFEDAHRSYDRAIALLRQSPTDELSGESRLLLAKCYSNLGITLYVAAEKAGTQKFDDLEATSEIVRPSDAFETAIQILQAHEGVGREEQLESAKYLQNLAFVLSEEREFAAAGKHIGAAIDQFVQLARPLPSLQFELANALDTHGDILSSQSAASTDSTAKRALLQRALNEYERALEAFGELAGQDARYEERLQKARLQATDVKRALGELQP